MSKPIVDEIHHLETEFFTIRHGIGLSKRQKLGKTLGTGSNNRVVALIDKSLSIPLALRRPLRDSDSRDAKLATAEARYSIITSRISVGVDVYDLWYVRKSTESQRRGLHMIIEYFETDLSKELFDNPTFILNNALTLKNVISNKIHILAQEGILAYDVKPANVVLNKNPLKVRMIDFGKEYTEYIPDALKELEEKNPQNPVTVSFIQKNGFSDDNIELLKQAFEVVMTIVISAHIAITIDDEDKNYNNILQSYRAKFMSSVSADMRRSRSSNVLDIVDEILFHKSVREVVLHYFDTDDPSVVIHLSHFNRY